MRKITEKEVVEYVSEVGKFEKEHRKYSSFYCWSNHTFTQKDMDDLAEDGIDASSLLGVHVALNGMWDDSWGTDWNSPEYYKLEEYEELVPEVVIPAHTVTKTRYEEFKMVFKDE